MKKRRWIGLFIVMTISLLISSCVGKKEPIPEAPTTGEVAFGNGVITLNWDEVESAKNYELQITLEEVAGNASRFVNLGSNIVEKPPQSFNITTEGTYTWKVRARNGSGNGPWTSGNPFYGEPKKQEEVIQLELSSHVIYECGTIVATATAIDPDIDKIMLMGRRDGEEEYVYETAIKSLNTNHEATFTLSQATLGSRGKWVINAQAYGNAVKSSNEEIHIKEVSLTPILKLKVYDEDVKDGDFVCVDELPVDGEYYVDIDFDDIEVVDYIDELLMVFEFTGHNDDFNQDYLAYHYLSPFDEQIWEEQNLSDIEPFFATECTKYATLTLIGTTCSGESSFSTFTNLDFVLDASKPKVSVNFNQSIPFGSEERNELLVPRPQIPLEGQLTKTATIQYSAFDTKSLCQATLSFFVYKVDANGKQMDGWEEVEIPWGQKFITIGNEERVIEGEATYSGILGKNASTSLYATVVLQLSELDGATITSSMEVVDCCNVGCENQCGNVFKRKPVSDEDDFFFDNVFYKVEMVNVDFIQEGKEFLITDLNNPASFTFQIADAYFIPDIDNFAFFFGEMPLVPPHQGIIERSDSRDLGPLIGVIPDFISSLFIDGDATLTVAECTGYPTKSTIQGLISILVEESTETAATFTIMGIDENLNIGIATQTFIVDTLAPSLTAVQGIKRNTGPGNDAIQFSFRAEDERQGVEPMGATVTVYDAPIDNTSRFLPIYYSKEHIKRLSEDSNVWMIDPLSLSVALNDEGLIKLEVLSADGYGNVGTSTLTGDVFNGSEER